MTVINVKAVGRRSGGGLHHPRSLISGQAGLCPLRQLNAAAVSSKPISLLSRKWRAAHVRLAVIRIRNFINHERPGPAQCGFGNQAYSRLIATSVNASG